MANDKPRNNPLLLCLQVIERVDNFTEFSGQKAGIVGTLFVLRALRSRGQSEVEAAAGGKHRAALCRPKAM